jgi:hypothetical protein
MIASKFKLLIVGLVLLQTQTCKKEDFKDVPTCILEKIQKIKTEDVANPPSSLWQYEYNGQTVYYIPAKCCDIPSSLYDADCNLICQPDGGFSGKGDGKCLDFVEKRTKGKLIWKDKR